MLTWNLAWRDSSRSFPARDLRVFLEMASGLIPSMEICSSCRPAAFIASMRPTVSRKPLVMMVATMPWARMRRMMASCAGWVRGSPPVRVTIWVPSRARASMRARMSASGTGLETLSYSLQ